MEAVSQAALHKELDLIQDIVKRMAANSFQIKTWMMGIVTAVLAFKQDVIFSGAGSCGNHTGAWLGGVLLVVITLFWYLDAFFLRTERMYRRLYAWVVANRAYTTLYQYDLNTFTRENFTQSPPATPQNLLAGLPGHWATMRSNTLQVFYLIPMLLVAAIIVHNLL